MSSIFLNIVEHHHGEAGVKDSGFAVENWGIAMPRGIRVLEAQIPSPCPFVPTTAQLLLSDCLAMFF